jgi:hypothetical protein
MTMIVGMANQPYPRRVGEDRILRRGEQLVVCSRTDMDEWRLQDTRRTAVYIDNEVWCLIDKQFTAAGEIHYILDPWPDNLGQLPGRRIRYNEEYVLACKEAERKKKAEDRVGPILGMFAWLIGFLPSRVKRSIEKTYGIPARSASFASIMIELLLFFAVGALLLICSFGAFHAWSLVVNVPLLILVVLILFVDLMMRYGSYFREDTCPLGFLEWLFKFGIQRPRE